MTFSNYIIKLQKSILLHMMLQTQKSTYRSGGGAGARIAPSN